MLGHIPKFQFYIIIICLFCWCLIQLEKSKTKGKGWFDLPATEITKEIEMDLQLIRMRKSLNPKQFFKNSDTGAAMPKYFQVRLKCLPT